MSHSNVNEPSDLFRKKQQVNQPTPSILNGQKPHPWQADLYPEELAFLSALEPREQAIYERERRKIEGSPDTLSYLPPNIQKLARSPREHVPIYRPVEGGVLGVTPESSYSKIIRQSGGTIGSKLSSDERLKCEALRHKYLEDWHATALGIDNRNGSLQNASDVRESNNGRVGKIAQDGQSGRLRTNEPSEPNIKRMGCGNPTQQRITFPQRKRTFEMIDLTDTPISDTGQNNTNRKDSKTIKSTYHTQTRQRDIGVSSI